MTEDKGQPLAAAGRQRSSCSGDLHVVRRPPHYKTRTKHLYLIIPSLESDRKYKMRLHSHKRYKCGLHVKVTITGTNVPVTLYRTRYTPSIYQTDTDAIRCNSSKTSIFRPKCPIPMYGLKDTVAVAKRATADRSNCRQTCTSTGGTFFWEGM